MTVCAVLMVKNEEDILEPVLRHLRRQVDWVLVADNGSSDGTAGVLQDLQAGSAAAWLTVVDDDEPGYWQSRKMSGLAQTALQMGHTWVLPCDADEIWYVSADPARTIKDYLGGVGCDVQVVRAELFNHLPTDLDNPDDPNPVTRLQWRLRQKAPLPKVACRLHPSLVIEAGNHGATYQGTSLAVGGLCVRHFSWRTREQYRRKIRDGQQAYAATDLPEATGAHWRMFEGATDDAIMEHFDRWFHSPNPKADAGLIRDPAPHMA